MLIREIGEIDRTIGRQTDLVTAEIERLRSTHEKWSETLQGAIDEKFKQLQAYFEANKAEICKKGRKSVNWPSGEMGLRFNPISAHFKLADAEEIIEGLTKAGLFARCCTVKTVIGKRELLAQRHRIPNAVPITFKRGEEFFVKAADEGSAEHTIRVGSETLKAAADA